MPRLPSLPDVEITLRRSAQSRRFSLRVSRVDGKVTLSMPHRARESEALAFLHAQEGWLRNTLSQMPQAAGVAFGEELPFEGRPLRLMPGSGRSLRVQDDSLLVPGDPAQLGARVQAWLKVQARDRLVAASDHYAQRIGRKVAQITLRDTRSRWGSCTHEGALMYSWRLIMAPAPVLRYVAAHEVAHMLEMNHSDRFWSVVDQLYPGWEVPRRWLKTHGSALHAVRF